MISNDEFQDLLAYIDTLDNESVAVMRETLNTFITGTQAKRKKLLEEHTKHRVHMERLQRVAESSDVEQLSVMRKKLGIKQ